MSMSKSTVIIRFPRVGERVEVHTADSGDAGLELIVGAQGVVTKVEKDERYGDWTFEVRIDGKGSEECDGGWGILAEYGVKFSDYFDGKNTLEAFWSFFESRDHR